MYVESSAFNSIVLFEEESVLLNTRSSFAFNSKYDDFGLYVILERAHPEIEDVKNVDISNAVRIVTLVPKT